VALWYLPRLPPRRLGLWIVRSNPAWVVAFKKNGSNQKTKCTIYM
jgi:hypothetical protein